MLDSLPGKEQEITLVVKIPTYGTEAQARDTAMRAVKELAVVFGDTLSGEYLSERFTFGAAGNMIAVESIKTKTTTTRSKRNE